MKVIGAGLSRTGTSTLRSCYAQLFGQPCYHMEVVLREPAHLQVWHAWATRGEQPDWHRLLDGFSAGVDLPICLFTEELMAAYPEAKVVLSVRDPDAWFQSWRALVRTNLLLRPMSPLVPRIRRTFEFFEAGILEPVFSGAPLEREVALAAYHRHNAHIREVVPADRLLVYDVKEGWEPLCAFLGEPVPDAPFPHLNAGMGAVRSTLGELFGVRL